MSGAWADARNVLAVRLDGLGDVLMTTPALRALKESVPERRLTLLTSPEGARAAACVPGLDDVIEYGAPWMKASGRSDGAAAERTMARRLSRGRFDAAVVFTVYTQSSLPAAFLCHLAGIPRRLAHCRENPYGLLTDWIEEPEPARVRHEVRRQLELVARVGCATADERISLRVSDAARRRALDALRSAGLDPRSDWAVVHPGACAPSRRWRADGFAEAAGRLSRERRLALAFTGSRDEAELIDRILGAMGARGAPAVSLAGRLSLEELAAAVAGARLLITNNTGPAHVAAAVGTPVVDLYALTNPQHAPWRVPARVLFRDVPCRFCFKSVCPERHHDCLRLVAADDVVAAAESLLEETAR